MKPIDDAEAQATCGGLTGIETAILMAVAGYVVANWTHVKQGFADGFAAGYNAAKR